MIDVRNNWLYIKKDETLDANCVSLFCLNLGTSTATIHGVPIPPYGWIKFYANEGEIDRTNYKVEFSTGGVNNLYVLKKEARQVS